MTKRALPRASGPIELRWTDIDSYGHVHISAQIALLDIGISRFLRSTFGEDQPPFVAVHHSVDFVSELTLDDAFAECSVSLLEMGTSSVSMAQRLTTLDGRLVSEATVVLVTWDRESRNRRPLTGEERAMLLEAGATPKSPTGQEDRP
jgi:acyl-CoA thioesterase FadM